MAELNLDERELCSDGSCIGVIGLDGRCKECGKPGKAPKMSPGRTVEPTDLDPDAASDGEPDDERDASAEAGVDDTDRELCPDGSCIGVIGDDGRCKVCGTGKDA
jgi:hypothetical protein